MQSGPESCDGPTTKGASVKISSPGAKSRVASKYLQIKKKSRLMASSILALAGISSFLSKVSEDISNFESINGIQDFNC